LLFSQKNKEKNMKDLYLWLAIIAGITAWTTFFRIWYHYCHEEYYTGYGWSFFFHPLDWCVNDKEDDLLYSLLSWFFSPIVWFLLWCCFILKYVIWVVLGGGLFDLFRRKK
jgi:hypothetical protein